MNVQILGQVEQDCPGVGGDEGLGIITGGFHHGKKSALKD